MDEFDALAEQAIFSWVDLNDDVEDFDDVEEIDDFDDFPRNQYSDDLTMVSDDYQML